MKSKETKLSSRSRRSAQLPLPLAGTHAGTHAGTLAPTRGERPTWGGRRKGAGRKRQGSRRMTPHRARPPHSVHHPVMITLRSLFRPLRSQHVLPTLRYAIRGANERDPEHFRITRYSVQYDHIHAMVEASSKRELSTGMRSLSIRIAREVNKLVGRRGRFWADRWHGRELTSPRQVRTALVYVLANFRKHARRAFAPGIDPFSSGLWFDGWQRDPALRTGVGEERAPPSRDAARDGGRHAGRESGRVLGPGPALADDSAPVVRPRTWLGWVGWQRYGLLRLDESPRRAR